MVALFAFRNAWNDYITTLIMTITNPKLQTLMGEETGRTYRLGQRVRVRLAHVDPRDQSMDFEL